MRSDNQIQQDVMEELVWEPAVDAAEIGVAVTDGIVTLSGKVHSYSIKAAAERAAKRVAGVRSVAENIEVKSVSASGKSDTEIAEAIIHVLEWNSLLRDEKVKIGVEDGWVTLEGEVQWNYQKKMLRSFIEGIVGVRGIKNLVTLAPKTGIKDIRQKINSAFHRHANIDAEKIKIEVHGDTVTLTGRVRSLAEKNDAEYAAYAAPGITHVENQLRVDYAAALMSM